jgi:hypothetical protein
MAMIAGPALFVTACVLPFFLWSDDRAEALLYWLGGWALAVAITAAGVVLAVFCWRFSGDWITEWPGYAVGIGIAAVAIVVQAYLMTSTPVPIVASFAMTMAAAFAVGFLVAGHLAGTQVLEETRAVHRQQRGRELVRRR